MSNFFFALCIRLARCALGRAHARVHSSRGAELPEWVFIVTALSVFLPRERRERRAELNAVIFQREAHARGG